MHSEVLSVTFGGSKGSSGAFGGMLQSTNLQEIQSEMVFCHVLVPPSDSLLVLAPPPSFQSMILLSLA
jgi:hypothetical protein